MSIAAQCSDCCTCPQPVVEWDSRNSSKTKCGLAEFGTSSTPPKIYSALTWAGTFSQFGVYFNTYNITQTTSKTTCVTTDAGTIVAKNDDTPCEGTYDVVNIATGGFSFSYSALLDCPGDGLMGTDSGTRVYTVVSTTERTVTYPFWSGSGTETLSDEYTTTQLKTNTVAALPAYDNDWNDTAGSFANLSTDELSYAIRESRYRLRFKIPRANTGKNYRASWVERFIAEAGVGIDSVEVYSPGVYRPAVTISAPPAGGTQAYAVAVMSPTGTVSSIRILNPGSGYSSAPTVTVQSATGGGTTSTGWTAALSTTSGQVTAITSGSAGNYLPTLAFSGGGGTGATATATMDDRGGISAVTLGASGSGYTSEPTLVITAKVSGPTAADLLLHLGTETARCAVWDGVTPSGYDPATPSTYPILGDSVNPYFELPVPSADGTTLVANLRAVCDGSACP